MNAAVSTRGDGTTVVEVVVASVVVVSSDTGSDVVVLPRCASGLDSGALDDDATTTGVGSLGGAGSPTGSVAACEQAAKRATAAHTDITRICKAAMDARYDADR